MSGPAGGIATGLVLALLGAFLVLRTVVRDSEGLNLVDRIIGESGGDEAAGSSSPAAAAGVGAAIAGGASVRPRNPRSRRNAERSRGRRPGAAIAAGAGGVF